MTLEKEPAGAFNKAQRLIERGYYMPSPGTKQERGDENPSQEAHFKKKFSGSIQ